MSRYIQKIIKDVKQDITLSGNSVVISNTHAIDGHQVAPFVPGTVNNLTGYDITGSTNFDTGGTTDYPVTTGDIGTPGAPPYNYEVAAPSHESVIIATVKRFYREAIRDYSEENLEYLEESGAKVYAKFDDETEVEVFWSEVFNPRRSTSTASFNIAEIAAANNQHFWTDTNGAHVTSDLRRSWDDEYAEQNHGTLATPTLQNPWHNILLNSMGILLRKGLINLAAMESGSIAFYDGLGNNSTNINAVFGSQGAQIGKDTDMHVVLDSSGLAAYDANGDLAPIQSSNIAADYAEIRELKNTYADIFEAYITYLDAGEIEATNINAMQASVDRFRAGTATVSDLTAMSGFIDMLVSHRVTSDYIEANYAEIGDLDAISGKFDNVRTIILAALQADIDSLTADEIEALDLTAVNAAIDNLETDQLSANDLTALRGVIDILASHRITTDILEANYAQINLANVNNAWIANGVIKQGAIGDAQIVGVSANKLTAGEINADEIMVRNLRAENLKVGRLNGQPVIGGYSVVSTSSAGYAQKNPTTEGWYEYVNGAYVLSQDTSVRQGVVYYTQDTQVALYDQNTIDGMFDNVDRRIDAQIQTHTGSAVPTLSNSPASSWNTNALKDEHIGDIYYVINAGNQADGYTYRFAYDNATSSYKWILIKDNQVTAALQDLIDVKGDISDLQEFQSDTTTWINETDEGLETIRQNHSTLVTNVNNGLASKVDTTTFNTVANTVNENSSTITTLSTKVDNIQIGGRNLLPHSKPSADNISKVLSRGSMSFVTEDNYPCYKIEIDGGNLWMYNLPVEANTTYIYSAWIKFTRTSSDTSSAPLSFISFGHFQVQNNASTASDKNHEDIVNDRKWSPSTISYNKWTRITITFTTNNLAGSVFRVIPKYTHGTDHILYIRDQKLEVGNKATDWTPAPEDMATSDSVTTVTNLVNQVKQTADENSAKLTSFTETVNGLGTRLSTAETSITQHTTDISLRATKTEMNSAIDNIKVGGRNLLRCSKPSAENLSIISNPNSTYNFFTTIDGFDCYSISGSSIMGGQYKSAGKSDTRARPLVKANTTYTYSCWVKITTTTSTTEVPFNHTSLGHTTVWVVDGGHQHADVENKRTYSPQTVQFNKWTYLVHTFTVGSSDCEFGVYPKYSSLPEGYTLYIRDQKLEIGNKATDWTPAPEDMQTVAQSQAELTVTNAAINAKVSKTDYTGATVASLINQSADSVKIQAKHVEIDGTAIFTNTNFQNNFNKVLDGLNSNVNSSIDYLLSGTNLLTGNALDPYQWTVQAPDDANFTKEDYGTNGVKITFNTVTGYEFLISPVIYVTKGKKYILSVDYTTSQNYNVISLPNYVGYGLSIYSTAEAIPNIFDHGNNTFIGRANFSQSKIDTPTRVTCSFVATGGYIKLGLNGGQISDGYTGISFTIDNLKLVMIDDYQGSIDIGGQNLARLGCLQGGYNGSTVSYNKNTNTYTVTNPASNTSSWGSGVSFKSSPRIIIPYGCEYRASMDIYTNESSDVPFVIDTNNYPVSGDSWTGGGTGNDNDYQEKRQPAKGGFTVPPKQWTRVSWGGSNTDPKNTSKVDLYMVDGLGFAAARSGQVWYIRNPMVQLGNVATDWTPAPEDVEADISTAQTTANSSSKRSQRIYYRSNSATKPNAPTSWVSEASSNVYNAWSTKVAPIAANKEANTTKYLYLYTCEQRETMAGGFTCTAVQLDENTTVIDGGNIITNSVKANHIDVDTLNAAHRITVGAFTDSDKDSILNSNVIVGGKNLLPFSKPSSENMSKIFASGGYSYVTEDGYPCYKIVGIHINGRGWSDKLSVYLKSNTTYTYSHWIKITTTQSGVSSVAVHFSQVGHFQVINKASTASDKAHEDYPDKRIITPSSISMNTWTKITITFTTNSLDNSLFGTYPKVGLDDKYTIYVRDQKLEIGNKATDWTPAPEDVDADISSVRTTANAAAPKTEAIKRSQRIYYRSNSATKPNAPGSWVSEASSNTYNAWSTKVAPIAANKEANTTKYLYLYTCEQRETVSGGFTCTAVQLDENTTVIDGGNIITNSVTANQINTDTLNAAHSLTVGALTSTDQNNILNSNIAIGGRNLLPFSRPSAANESKILIGAGHTFVTEDGYPCYKVTGGSTNGYCFSVTLRANTTYTFSAWLKFTCTSNTNSVAFGYTSFGHYQVSNEASTAGDKSHEDIVNKRVWSPATIPYNTWTKITITFTTNNLDGSYFHYYPKYSYGTEYTSYFRDCKLELGNKATDWTPAPEDAETGISDAAKTATNYITQVDNNGIKIHAVNNTSSNYSLINASGMTVYKGGSQVAQFGDTILLGSTSGQGARVNSDGLQIFKGGSQVASFGTTVTIGNPNDTKLMISSKELYFTDTKGNKAFSIAQSQTNSNYGSAWVEYFVGDGSTKKFNLKYTASILNAEYYTITFFNPAEYVSYARATKYIEFSSALPNDSVVAVSYFTNDVYSFSYNLGTGNTSPKYLGGFSFGNGNTANNSYSVCMGSGLTAQSPASAAFGAFNYIASSAPYAFASGMGNQVLGEVGYAEGLDNCAGGIASHAEGCKTNADGSYSHTEGFYTTAQTYAHAGGKKSTAGAICTFAHGEDCNATGSYSVVFGKGCNDGSKYANMFVIGMYNSPTQNDYFEIGNGSSNTNRSNAFRVTKNSVAYLGSSTVSSDIRVKSDISDLNMNDAYEFISNLKPKSYIKFERRELGFIAQDIEKLIYGDILVDESQNYGYNDFKNLSYDGLIAPLVATVQILQKENEELKQKNEELEKRLAKLEAILLKDGDI